MKIHLPRNTIRYFTFTLYNLFYVTYMMGYTSQVFYLGTLMLFCLMNLSEILRRGGIICKGLKDFRLGMGYILTFLCVSLLIQFLNRDFEAYLFSGLLRITLPIVNAFLIVNSFEPSEFGALFDVLLARFVVHFVWENYSNFNLAGLMSISWANSNSVMESSMAHDFLVMEIYYLSRKENRKAFICMIFCMLSMKRLSFILAPTLFIAAKIAKSLDSSVKKAYIRALKGIAIVSPFMILVLYSEGVQNLFLQWFHLDLNDAMSGRVAIYNTLVNNIPYYNGYGSINAFLEKFVSTRFGTYWNAILHNDFLRIYYETTIIGVVVLANNLVELSKRNYWHFIIVAYLMFVAITSHILNYFSVWITFYMIVFCSHVEVKCDNTICYKREEMG